MTPTVPQVRLIIYAGGDDGHPARGFRAVQIGDTFLDSSHHAITDCRFEAHGVDAHRVTIELICSTFESVVEVVE